MSNALLISTAWLAFVVHVVVGIVVRRRLVELPLVPLLNLATSLCVIAYWGLKWFGYLFQGITWNATDQLLPLYALVVCILSALAISGRSSAALPHWIIFGVHTLVLLAAALFFSLFRINRLF